VQFSYTETWDYPVEWGEKRIRADLEKRIAAENAEERKWVAELPEDRKAVCRDWPNKTPSIELPADCERLFVATNSELAVPTGWEAQLPQPIWSATRLLWALGPPVAAFLLGAGMIWVGDGFRVGYGAGGQRRGLFRLWLALALVWLGSTSLYLHLVDPDVFADGKLTKCGPVAGGEEMGWYCKSGGDLDDNGNITVVPFEEALTWTLAPPAMAFLLGLALLWLGNRFRRPDTT
jgi:hypothetical protein